MVETDSNDNSTFVDSLRRAIDMDYAEVRYKTDQAMLTNIPTVPEAICHLKLLKAFEVYKRKLIGPKTDNYSMKTWQVFVTNAVRRFIIFITALQKDLDIDAKNRIAIDKLVGDSQRNTSFVDEGISYRIGANKNRDIIDFLGKLLPPLDIIMVWHALLLNPRSWYDVFTRNQFLQFANYPFPLLQISKYIDDASFEFLPDEYLQNNYQDLVNTLTYDSHELQYTISHFTMFQLLIDIFCPICGHKLLTNVPYITEQSSGFADEAFNYEIEQNTTKCDCKLFSNIITHDELRKRQLYADIHSQKPLPGIFKYFSKVISHRKHYKRDALLVDNHLKTTIKKNISDDNIWRKPLTELIHILLSSSQHFHRRLSLILRNYPQMNLIHLSIFQGFQVWEDLVGCVIRQELFASKMCQFDWLHSSLIQESLSESILRYTRFFSMLTTFDNKRMLVPTLDIDLIWHTHQLSTYYYFRDCMNSVNKSVIDHDDKVESGRLDSGFADTIKLYQDKFKQKYSICFCWYCVNFRNNSQSKMKGIFKRKSNVDKEKMKFVNSPLFSNALGLTHISTHNAIDIPSPLAIMKREELYRKYPGEELPWNDDNRQSFGIHSNLFVLGPVDPIKHDNISLYDEGLCGTVRDFGPTCTGLSGCSTAPCANTRESQHLGCGGGNCGGFPGTCQSSGKYYSGTDVGSTTRRVC